MSIGVNPLVVAQTGGQTTSWSGVYLAEDIQLLHQGVKNGSWIDTGLGGVGAALDTLGLIVDPLGTLAAWGGPGSSITSGHSRKHSTGSPGTRRRSPRTLRHGATSPTRLRFAAGDYRTAVTRQTDTWSGPARTHSGEHAGAMAALSDAADAMGSIVEGSGMVVALVRTLMRDAIAEFVSVLAVRLTQ